MAHAGAPAGATCTYKQATKKIENKTETTALKYKHEAGAGAT